MMILLPVCLLVSLILLRTAPDMPLSHFLHRWLVTWPISRICGLKSHELLLLASATVAIAACHWFFQPDSLVFTSRFLAEAPPWLTSVEVSIFLDAATAVLLSGATTRAREILRLGRRTAVHVGARHIVTASDQLREAGKHMSRALWKGISHLTDRMSEKLAENISISDFGGRYPEPAERTRE